MTRQERQILLFLLLVFTTGFLFLSARRFQFYQNYVQKYPNIPETALTKNEISSDIEERDEKRIGSVHINSADVETLILLPGIGRETALRIIEYRSTTGPFAELTDLLNVSGIGEKKLEKMKGYLILD
jgi:competence ComEA-like helix-hairpin-helix protein